MRCNWTTTARRTFQSLGRTSHPNRALCTKWAQPEIVQTSRPAANYHTLLTSTPCNAALSPATEPAPPALQSSLTPAQKSRAACQAVRLSLQSGELEDAYLIVNSLHSSLTSSGRHDVARLSDYSQPVKDLEAVAVHLTRDVSPRLSSHALLHGLLRLGLMSRAFRLASTMMESGIRLRSRTLEGVVRGLVPHSSNVHLRGVKPTPPIALMSAQNFMISKAHSLAQDKGTRLAIQLLSVARKTHHRRTDGMFATLICLCLINGEIILASLLFGFVVKDWQLKESLAVHFATSPPVEAAEWNRKDLSLRARYDHLRVESIFPRRQLMYSILSSIDERLSEDGEGEEFQSSLESALQALANLAGLLDHRQIPFSQVAPLIRSLYNCPRVEDRVWIVDDKGHPKRVKAYPYFHSVLKRLIETPPTKRPPILTSNQRTTLMSSYVDAKQMQPPLNLAGYNSLLHYALRHRLSPTLAEKLTKHMFKERHKPDIATYNILIRSGTLLRKSSIADQALDALRRRLETKDGGRALVPISPDNAVQYKTSPSKPIKLSRLPKTARHLNQESGRLLPEHSSAVEPDFYTLSSYITYLTSTGQPHIIADLFFRIFPELGAANTVSEISVNAEERRRMRDLSRQACLKRAVTYGPYFFTAMLNALRKAGKTGLAERVWLLAKRAEQASWDPEFDPEAKPWRLPVHAYTIMMQCYGMESRKWLWKHNSFQNDDNASALEPRSAPYVVGWGQPGRLQPQQQRSVTGRRLGLLLYRSVMAQAEDSSPLPSDKTKIAVGDNMQVPRPDARFFNAALYLFSRQPSMRTRRARQGRAHWRRHLRFANLRHAQSGTCSKHWNPWLQEVGEDMVKAGYPIPPGLRHIFVGRWNEGTWQWEPPHELDRRPLLYPRNRKNFIPHSIPTHKRRGLPLGRRQIRGSAHNVS